MKTGYIPAAPRKVHFIDAEDLQHPQFVVPRGCEVSITERRHLTDHELEVFGLSKIQKRNTDLEPVA